MKLIEALQIVGRPMPDDASELEVSLVCGCTPLHLETFLHAELRERQPQARVTVSSGVFDDLIGNLDRADRSSADAVAVVVEWADIDPRLGLRRAGGWRTDDLTDIVDLSGMYLAQLGSVLTRVARSKPVICCLPTLPLPPLFSQRPDQSGAQELQLRNHVAALAAELGQQRDIRVCSAQVLDEVSPLLSRRDVQMELSTGFPYSLAHASALAGQVALLISNPTPLKGLITDLDDTLWAGILGEVGAANVTWDLDSHSQRHALYQQFLGSLASTGILIGVASKNDAAAVEQAFDRPDLLLPKDAVFPFVVHWGPKSSSVRHILKTWNIAPEAVALVDDSETEIAEVQSLFPDVQCFRFPTDDSELWSLLRRLRGLFGKSTATAEDALRVASVRSASEFREFTQDSGSPSDDFLARAEGTVEFSSSPAHKLRAFDLLNKTNQFNLNGNRIGEAAFNEALRGSGTELVTASYRDRYGRLGIILALLAHPDGRVLMIDAWVMSCRAFSRRIEYHCLQYLFERFDATEIVVDYRSTDRNGPVQEFLKSVLPAPPSSGSVRITAETFHERAPALVHHVLEAQP